MITMVKKVAICRPFLVILVAITVCTHDLIFQYFIFSCNFIEKETLAQALSCEFYEISKNTFLQNTSGLLFLNGALRYLHMEELILY